MRLKFAWPLWLAALLFAGCATHRVDWNTRVGAYTYDQAVTELGPPDKKAALTDGTFVAEWITHYYGNNSVAVGTGFYGGPGSVGFIQSVGPNSYDSKLRLSFGTNNVLTKWSKN
jgi:hypothetical protein